MIYPSPCSLQNKTACERISSLYGQTSFSQQKAHFFFKLYTVFAYRRGDFYYLRRGLCDLHKWVMIWGLVPPRINPCNLPWDVVETVYLATLKQGLEVHEKACKINPEFLWYLPKQKICRGFQFPVEQ